MDVGNTQPAGASQEAFVERLRTSNERFAAGVRGGEDDREAREPESDANTRLSREADAVELSDESRELARRFEEGSERA